ncbi:MAG: hypothetical protein KF754_00565 [Planctomycetes bacterium]|nr:hypothetical protein [Planctomycetota bacterium]
MRVVVVNTALEPKHGGHCEDGLQRMIAKQCAAAWVTYDSEEAFLSVERGESVVLYENGRGYVAFGTATGERWITRKATDARRLDTDRDGEEHCQGVIWDAWIPAPTAGFLGVRHPIQTCCRKDLTDQQWRELKAYIQKHTSAR